MPLRLHNLPYGSDRLRLAANLLPETLGSALVLDSEKEVAFVVSG